MMPRVPGSAGGGPRPPSHHLPSHQYNGHTRQPSPPQNPPPNSAIRNPHSHGHLPAVVHQGGGDPFPRQANSSSSSNRTASGSGARAASAVAHARDVEPVRARPKEVPPTSAQRTGPSRGSSSQSRDKASGPYQVGNGRSEWKLLDTTFNLPNDWNVDSVVGSGAYGLVASATNDKKGKGKKFAIKRCNNLFKNVEDGKRVLREIKLLTFLNHPNVLSVCDLIPPPRKDRFNEVCMVSELMDFDLNKVIKSKQPLNHLHYKYFMTQMLQSLKFVHSANIIHRDLKPANVLVSFSCELKLCDFGLARGFDPTDRSQELTSYVVTRYYRPPELLMAQQQYTPAVDIWSAGCIFGEMFKRTPIFRGKNYLQELSLVTAALGTPEKDDMDWIPKDARSYVSKKPCPKKPWVEVIPELAKEPGAVEFIDAMLQFNPSKRQTAAELLAHPYLSTYRNPEQETVAPGPFHWDYDGKQLNESQLRYLFWEEICKFNPELESLDAPGSNHHLQKRS